MKTRNLSATLMAFGLLMAAPAFAQTAPVQKQPTQEGGSSFAPLPNSQPYNANPTGDPNYKQRTQEGGGPDVTCARNANPAANADCNPGTLNLSPSSAQADAAGKQK
jgi:hypothetical protein